MHSDPLDAARLYPRKRWYVAGYSSDFRREIDSRRIFDEPLVFFRTEDDVTDKKIEVKESRPRRCSTDSTRDKISRGNSNTKLRCFVPLAFGMTNTFLGNPNVLGWVLGREPIPLAQFVSREWKAWLAEKRAVTA